jgi:hypothetical protein
MDRRAEALALCATLLTAIMVVLVFFPAEGRVLVPIHEALNAFLGQTTFVLPLGLTLLSALAFARRLRPGLRVPRARLVGLGLITIALLPADHLLGASTGLVGDWLTSTLINAVGEPFAIALTSGLVLLGSGLAFNIKVKLPNLNPLSLLIAAR